MLTMLAAARPFLTSRFFRCQGGMPGGSRSALRRYVQRRPAFQPRDQASAEYQADGDELRARHQAAEDHAAALIAAQKLDEETLDPVEHDEGRKHLPVELLT